MALGLEANGDNLGSLLDPLFNNGMFRVLIRIAPVLMSTQNIFMIKQENFPKCLFFLSYQKNFTGSPKCVRIIQDKRAIGVRVIEVLP